jgi:hypothetical protein
MYSPFFMSTWSSSLTSLSGWCPLQRLIAVCIFLASKIEEASVGRNDLLAAVKSICSNLPSAIACFPSLTSVQRMDQSTDSIGDGSEVLTLDAYEERKRQLIHDEQVLLRILRFRVAVEQPYKYLFSMCKSLNVSETVVRVSTCLLNDSFVYTPLTLTHTPQELAGAALMVAEGLSREDLCPDRKSDAKNPAILYARQKKWLEGMDIDHQKAKGAAECLERILKDSDVTTP